MHYTLFDSGPRGIGFLTLCFDEYALLKIDFGAVLPETGAAPPTALSREICRQLSEYFSGQRRVFNLALRAEGTNFQRQVWEALQKIPYGETRSYSEIAAAVGRPRACRAVGLANHHNPLPIVIPCHRVIGQDRSLVGFGGGLAIKSRLLALEGWRP